VFLSHMDMDHINGVRELLERQTCSIKIKNLVLEKMLLTYTE
jgi:phosphoribosyl 1,2-cyclic phosphodiesterase